MAVGFFFFRFITVRGNFGKVMNETLQHYEMIFVSEANDHITIGGPKYPMRKGMLSLICSTR